VNIRMTLLAAALALSFNTLAAPQAQEGAPQAESSKALYWQGHEALGQKDWDAALESFRKLEVELARSKSEPADAAIYWQAYALSQARRHREAEAAAARLRETYPGSKWLDDARALGAKDKADKAERQRDPREQDALMALDALLAGGNQKAVPMLQRVMAGDHTDRVKSRALFVLTQIDEAAANDALDTIIRGNGSPRLKSEAIRMIAAGGNKASLDRLVPLYRGTQDEGVRRGVLDAFLIGDRPDLILQVLQSETDARARRRIIEKLGPMGRTKELTQLYATLTDKREKRAALQGLGVAGSAESLLQVARSEKDPELRAAAIRAVGIAGNKKNGDALVAFYAPGEPEDVRRAVVQALMMTDATDKMVDLYRKETDPGLRRELLTQITTSDPDAALELIDQALKR
jgi:HEAT repeat protein